MDHAKQTEQSESPKKRITALLLAIFLGFIGLQWWYVGNWRWGLTQSSIFAFWLFLGFVAIPKFYFFGSVGCYAILALDSFISLAAIIMIFTGSFKDSKGRYLISWQK